MRERPADGSRRPLNPDVNELAEVHVSAMHDLAEVLRIRDFRRLFNALALSSLGDWLGLLATTALAADLAGSASAQLYAIAGVLLVRLMPALLFGPFAGAFADRFDRRWTMIASDLVRGVLFIVIVLADRLDVLIAATFLIETFSLFWIPAKEASVPNLLAPEQLQTANQLSLIVTYGSAVPAAALFTLLSSLNSALASGIGFFHSNPVDLALYFDAATFFVAAFTVLGLSTISGRSPRHLLRGGDAEPVSLLRSIGEGWAYVGRTPLVRGLVVGILGAFGAGGGVIALSRPYVTLLGAGNAAYGLLFGDVFLGLALGFTVGPRLLGDISRKRLFGMCIVGAGAALTVVAVVPNLALALVFVLVCTSFGGVAWVTGYTLLGLEVPNELRGRTFGFVQSMIQVILFFTLAAAPAIAGVIGRHRIPVGHGSFIRADGVTTVLLAGGLLAVFVGVTSFRQMDDRKGVSIIRELAAALHVAGPAPPAAAGFLVAFEGGEGAGKSTQLGLLAAALAEVGYDDVVVTHEPGATTSGAVLRTLLLDPATVLSPRAEALVYAADRAEHVHRVLRPALAAGAVVLCDRYVDSSLAYQGAGRDLDMDGLRRLQRMATDGLSPDLTVLLDLPAEAGLARVGVERDRIEQQPLEFHRAVREAFVALARRERGRYLVVDATAPVEQIAAQVAEEVQRRLLRVAEARHVHRTAAAAVTV